MKGLIDFDDRGREIVAHHATAESVNGVMEICKARQSSGLTGTREMKHLAEFPGFIIQQYCDAKGITWAEWMQNGAHARAMLNDPALAYFRIDASRVSKRGE